jgi:hypothetical protein
MALFNIISVLRRNTSEATDYWQTPVATTVTDTGYYEAFPMPEQYIDGSLLTLWKKSGDHASAGALILSRSIDGGTTWVHDQVNVGGTLIESAAHSFCVLSDGRLIIAYQDDELYTSVKFAYRDGLSGAFTAGTTYSFGAGYSSSPSPVKMKVMPSGKIYFGYYKFGLTTNPAIIGFLESTDDGETFVLGPQIFSRTTQATASPYTDWKGHEFGFEITHNTGTDATCKMIALVRVNLPDEGGTYYMHFKSADGGDTWTYDSTEDAGSFNNDLGALVSGPFSRHLFYSFLASNSPVDIKLHHDGYVYVVNGERNAAEGYKLKYCKALPDDAYANVWDDWTRPTEVKAYIAVSGESIDCGYPVLFHVKASEDDVVPELWCQDYDRSALANTVNGDPRCKIMQVKIVD